MNPNHYLAAAIFYLFTNRPAWPADAAIGKTLVSSSIDRSRRGEGRPRAGRGAGRVQVVRARADRWRARVWRRGERRRLVPATRRLGVDDRQGRHHHEPAGAGDHRPHRPQPVRPVRLSHQRARRTGVRPRSTRRRRRKRKPCSRACRRPMSVASTAGRRSDYHAELRLPPATVRALAASRLSPPTDGSPRVHQGPRMSTSSTRRVFAGHVHLGGFRMKPVRLSARHSPRSCRRRLLQMETCRDHQASSDHKNARQRPSNRLRCHAKRWRR